MVEFKDKLEPADPSRVNVDDDAELTCWAEYFGIDEAQLKAFVQAVGPIVEDVQEEIERVP